MRLRSWVSVGMVTVELKEPRQCTQDWDMSRIVSQVSPLLCIQDLLHIVCKMGNRDLKAKGWEVNNSVEKRFVLRKIFYACSCSESRIDKITHTDISNLIRD